MNMARFAAPATLLCLAASAAAQTTSFSIPPSQVSNPVFGRSVLTMVSGHTLPDLVVLATGTYQGTTRQLAMIAAAPGVHHSLAVLPGTASLAIRDVAVVPAGDPARPRDALLLATAQGLRQWTFGGNVTSLGGSIWNNATRIKVGNLYGDGPCAIGRMGDENGGNPNNLRILTLSGNVPGQLVNTGSFVLDYLPIDWVANAGSPRDEIAVAHADAIRFVREGIVDATLTIPLPTNTACHLTSIPNPGGGRRLVATYRDTTGGWNLASFAPNGTPTATTLPHAVGGLTTVPTPATIPPGIVLTWSNHSTPSVYAYDPNLPNQAGFSPRLNLDLNLGSASGNVMAHYVDLNGDGGFDTICSNPLHGKVDVRKPWPGPRIEIAVDFITERFQVSNLPAWATHVEVSKFQFERLLEAEEPVIADIRFHGTAFERVTLTRDESFPQPPTTIGPVGFLVRPVEQQAGATVRRGGAQVFLWAFGEDADFLYPKMTALVGFAPNELVPNHYGGIGPPDDVSPFPPPEPEEEIPEDPEPPAGGGGGG